MSIENFINMIGVATRIKNARIFVQRDLDFIECFYVWEFPKTKNLYSFEIDFLNIRNGDIYINVK
jgi:hypothetical protein